MSGICVMFAYLMPFIIQDRLYIVEAFESALAMKYNSVWVSSTPMLWWQVRNSAWLWTLWQRARRQECKVLRRYHYPDWLSVISFPRSTRAFWMLHLNLLRNGNRCLRLFRWSGGQTLIKPSLMPSWRVLLMTCGPWPKKSFSARGDGLDMSWWLSALSYAEISLAAEAVRSRCNRSIPAQLNQLDELRSEGHIFQVGKVPRVLWWTSILVRLRLNVLE